MTDTPPTPPTPPRVMPASLSLLGTNIFTEVDVRRASDGNAWVVLRVEHSGGSTVVGLAPQHARNLAAGLTQQAAAAELLAGTSAGQIIVPGAQPNGKRH